MVLPIEHKSELFDLNQETRSEIMEVTNICVEILKKVLKPGGFNVGINIGESAGQTCMYPHVHLIFRRDGDMENPRGGVRGVIPSKQNY